MKNKQLLLILLALIALALLAAAVSAVMCAFNIKTTVYKAPVKGLKTEIKAVMLSDLHGREFGKDNEKLLALIKEQEPDVIFADGDLISRNADEDDIAGLLDFMTGLTELAPVYCSTGNHEVDYMEEHGEELLELIAGTGAVVLYDSFVEAEINGSPIRIGGTSGHYRDSRLTEQLDQAMQEEIGSTETPSVVLIHMPENMVCDSAVERWDADLYLSGHTHGGLIRLPVIGGLYAPTQGLFPEYDAGRFLVDGRLDLIISSGLAGYGPIPRIFNPPEICVILFTPE